MLLIGLMILSLNLGAMNISSFRVISEFFARKAVWLTSEGSIDWGQTSLEFRVLVNIRLPRIIYAVISGMALSIAGTTLQGLFRNPLVDPGLLGISTGASFGVGVAIILGLTGIVWLPIAAFLGALSAGTILFVLGSSKGQVSIPVLILAGIAVNGMFGAGVGYLVFLADDTQIRDITFWSLGSLSGIQWNHVITAGIPAMVSLVVLGSLARGLNGLHLGEREATHLGISVNRIKIIILLFSVLGVGSLTAFSGVIGFIGLIGPHITRKLLGSDHHVVLPGAALLGGILVLAADTLARTVVAPAELPIGVVTASLGGPFFLYLIMKRRDQWQN